MAGYENILRTSAIVDYAGYESILRTSAIVDYALQYTARVHDQTVYQNRTPRLTLTPRRGGARCAVGRVMFVRVKRKVTNPV